MTDTDTPRTTTTTRWVKRVVVGCVGVVVLAFGAIFIYAEFINDAPDELTTADLSDALLDTVAPAGEHFNLVVVETDPLSTPGMARG